MEKPLMRMCYKHVAGKFFVVQGFANHMKTQVEIVIITSLDDASIQFIELENFFDKHPTSGVPRFELVKPS